MSTAYAQWKLWLRVWTVYKA